MQQSYYVKIQVQFSSGLEATILLEIVNMAVQYFQK